MYFQKMQFVGVFRPFLQRSLLNLGRFSRWLEFPKKCAKHYPEHLLLLIDRAQYRAVIWDLFWDIGANKKAF